MIKNIFKVFILLIIILVIIISYLSYFGIKTNKFNNIIEDRLNKINPKISIVFESTYLKLKPFKFSFRISVDEPQIRFNTKIIQVENIRSDIQLKTIFSEKKSLKNLLIVTKQNELNHIIDFIRLFKNNIKTMLFDRFIDNGYINISAEVNFDDNGKVKDDFIIKGEIENTDIYLLDRSQFSTSLNFIIKDKLYLFKKLQYNYNGIEFKSDKIEIALKKDKSYLFSGDVSNLKSDVLINNLPNYIKKSVKFLDQESLNFESDSNFSFVLDEKFKIFDIKLDTKIFVDSFKSNNDYKTIKKIFNFDDDFLINENEIAISYIDKSKNNNKSSILKINGKGIVVNQEYKDKFTYNFISHDSVNELFVEFYVNQNPIYLDILDFKKSKNDNSKIILNSIMQNGKNLIKELSLNNSNNKFKIDNLLLDNSGKIENFENLNFNFKNSNKVKNDLNIRKKKDVYQVKSKVFDASKLINKFFESSNKKEYFVERFNNKFAIDLRKVFIDKENYLNDLKGNVTFNNSSINDINLLSYFSNNKELKLNLKTLENGEKVTNLTTGYPKPLIQRYKFIKGFEEGTLDFKSIYKNKISNNVLIIDNFKVKEVPVFAKLLTLASLQGIADLLTGEGIRFTDFEMKYNVEKNLTKIDELYAIGPAVSIMMDGYIEKDKLVSLRGTLVPATTVNRTISSIPLLGDILVGKKVGEGVFGVSFKIKGPPKNLKTSVNPIKTLTPRFITRTLEKIKN